LRFGPLSTKISGGVGMESPYMGLKFIREAKA
jgi:hypothetical protein